MIGERAGHELYITRGKVGFLQETLIHEDLKPLSAWIDRHNNYASINAHYLWSLEKGTANARISDQVSDRRLYRKEKFREQVWNKLPIGVRPFLIFSYNFFCRLGFLDGLAGFIYGFLHDFWFPWLVDAKLLELRARDDAGNRFPEIHRETAP
jgi:hypothetical protein